MTDIVIDVKPVVLSDGQAKALDFFRRDKSSVDGELSYDDRAMTPGRPDEFDRTDVGVIRRGMGLDRIRKTVWDWLVEDADVSVLEALPRNVHLADVSEDEYPAIREGIEAALREFVGDGEYRGLTVASKGGAPQAPDVDADLRQLRGGRAQDPAQGGCLQGGARRRRPRSQRHDLASRQGQPRRAGRHLRSAGRESFPADSRARTRRAPVAQVRRQYPTRAPAACVAAKSFRCQGANFRPP